MKKQATTTDNIEKFTKEADKAGIPGQGHNKKANRVGGINADQLKAIIARVEKLEEEKAGIGMDIKDVFHEAKGNGFDVKAIRQIIALRRKDAQEIEEEENILDTYKRALGMIPQLDFDFDNDAA